MQKVKEELKRNSSLPKYKLVLAPNFRATREKIFAYIRENWWGNSVDNFHGLLMQKMENLQYFPNSHSNYFGTEYRRFLVWDYLILFKVKEAKSEVVVYGIYHSSQNLSEMMEDLE